jgi:hypothetical protein
MKAILNGCVHHDMRDGCSTKTERGRPLEIMIQLSRDHKYVVYLMFIHIGERRFMKGGDYRKLMPIGAFDDHEACEHVVQGVEETGSSGRGWWDSGQSRGMGPAFDLMIKWWSSPLSLVF